MITLSQGDGSIDNTLIRSEMDKINKKYEI